MFHILLAALLILLGYLIKYRQWSWLIAGYNTSSKQEKEKYDTAALCTGVGNFILTLAGLLLIAALGELIETAWIIHTGWIMFIAASVIFLVYANTGERYKK